MEANVASAEYFRKFRRSDLGLFDMAFVEKVRWSNGRPESVTEVTEANGVGKYVLELRIGNSTPNSTAPY